MEGQGWSLCLVIFLLTFSHNVSAEKRVLDMAPDAVDDVFSGCRDRVIQSVTAPGGLLQKELKARKDFTEMWRGHGGTCEKQIYGATPHHLAALQAYGNSGVKFRKTFNGMVQTKGRNSTTYLEEFPFKSLHFLLTDALRLLNPGKTCRTVYFGTSNLYTAETGKEVRFGRFLHPRVQESSEIEAAESEGQGTLFNITSCSVVNVENYTCTSEEIEQLISPTEVFTVQSIKHISSDEAQFKIITLTHSRFLSNHDCYLFTGFPIGSSPPLLTNKTLTLVLLILAVFLPGAVLYW
ncbi:hypothetical protein NFI96_017021 [Prochilodus magdalenae]|nr:hypothetical protein NFI96_017021 [Prochilodus magdalenae]